MLDEEKPNTKQAITIKRGKKSHMIDEKLKVVLDDKRLKFKCLKRHTAFYPVKNAGKEDKFITTHEKRNDQFADENDKVRAKTSPFANLKHSILFLDNILHYHEKNIDQSEQKLLYPRLSFPRNHPSTLDLSPFVDFFEPIFSSTLSPFAQLRFSKISCFTFNDCPTLSDEKVRTLLQHSIALPIRTLIFSKCPNISNEVTSLISSYVHASSITQLHFESCRDIGDGAIDNLLSHKPKYRKISVKSISFSKCPLITENGYIRLIKKQYLSLSSINFSSIGINGNVTDSVLLVIADRYRRCTSLLKKVDFCGCNKITDIGVEEIVTKCSSAGSQPGLRELYLSFCTKLTSSSIRSFCKVPVVYGMKMNTNLNHLSILHLEGNQNLTMDCLVWIGKACPRLEELNLRACRFQRFEQNRTLEDQTQILCDKEKHYIKHLSSLVHLRVLDICYCEGLFLNQTLIQTYFSECLKYREEKVNTPNFPFGMECLDLRGISRLSNENLVSIANLHPFLKEFSISGCSNVTDAAITTIVTETSDLKIAKFSNLKSISDDAIHIISKFCFQNLVELDISKNSQLSTSSLQNLDRMQSLSILDISFCSRFNDLALKWLPTSSLRSLVANGLPLLTDIGIRYFCERHKEGRLIECLSFKQCTSLTSDAITCIHVHFLELKLLEVSDSKLNVTDFPVHDYEKKYLTPIASKEFYGLIQTPKLRDKKKRDSYHSFFMLRHCAARTIQISFRLHTRQKAIIQHFTERNKQLIVKIFSSFKHFYIMHKEKNCEKKENIARKKVAIILQNLLWVRGYQRWAQIVLKRRFSLWKQSFVMNLSNSTKAKLFHDKKRKTKIIKTWVYIILNREKECFRQHHIALNHWKRAISSKVFFKWLKELKVSSKILQQNKLSFMLVAHTNCYNTRKQIRMIQVADAQRKKYMIWNTWKLFKRFMVSSCFEREQISKAVKFNKVVTYKRFGGKLLRALNHNANVKRIVHKCEARANLHMMKTRKLQALTLIKKFMETVLEDHMSWDKASMFHKTCFVSKCRKKTILAISSLQYIRLHQKQLKNKAKQLHLERNLRSCLKWLKKWITKHKNYRQMIIKATMHRNVILLFCFLSKWAKEILHSQIIESVVLKRCKRKRTSKAFLSWVELCYELKKEKANNDYKQFFLSHSSTQIQKIYIGWKTRRKVKEWIIFRNWAVLLCQTRCRIFLSRQQREKKQRMKLLNLYSNQENELKQMEREDQLVKAFVVNEKVAIKVQRIVRGKKGRSRAFSLLQKSVIHHGLQLKDQKLKQLNIMKKQKEERKTESNRRIDSALILEKYCRGYIGRRLYTTLQKKIFEEKCVKRVQAVFRGIQGRRLCYAHLRHNKNLSRRKKARLKQARYLKQLGFKTNKAQNKILKHLRFFGLEATTFVTSFIQQKNDIKEDFDEIRKSIAFHKKYLFSSSRNRACRSNRTVDEMFEAFNPKAGDAVRVLIEDHNYVGMTGQVLYFDEKTFAMPVAVVKMDVDGSCHPFFTMSKEHKFLSQKPSLYIIDDKDSPNVRLLYLPKQLRARIIKYANAEEQIALRNQAASFIQKRIRLILSNKNTSLKRFQKFLIFTSMNRTCLLAHYQMSMKAVCQINSCDQKCIATQKQERKYDDAPRIEKIKGDIMKRIMIRFEYRDIVRDIEKKKAVLKLDEISTKSHFRPKFSSRIRTKRVKLSQLRNSPFVRMDGLAVYRGTNNLYSSLKMNSITPNGVGYVEFFKGFQSGQNDKLLKLTVCKIRDLFTSDYLDDFCPFIEILCCRKRMRTSIKGNTIAPVWNEVFNIYINNPKELVRLKVYNRNQFSRNSLLGEVVLNLLDLHSSCKAEKRWYEIQDSNNFRKVSLSSKKKRRGLGFMELELSWTPQEVRDDNRYDKIKFISCIIVQCWFRTLHAQKRIKTLKHFKNKEDKFIQQQALTIQCAFRVHHSVKKYRKYKILDKIAVRIQCYWRNKCACSLVTKLRCMSRAACSIQCCFRRMAAISIKTLLLNKLQILQYSSATKIQSMTRLYLSNFKVDKKMELMDKANMDRISNSYLKDQCKTSKRMKRICKRIFDKILQTKDMILVTAYGEVYLDEFPVPDLPFRIGSIMIKVYLHGHKSISLPKKEFCTLHSLSSCFRAVLRLDSIDSERTLFVQIRRIQCFFRCEIASRCLIRKRMERKAAIWIQRKFRIRCGLKIKIAVSLQRFFRINNKKLLMRKRGTINRHVTNIQCLVRSFLAKLCLEKHLEIECRVKANSSSFSDTFGAEKVLDRRMDTFWCTQRGYISSQWITFDLLEIVGVGEIKVKVPNMTSSPMEIEISAGNDSSDISFTVGSVRLEQKASWQKFALPKVAFRFWKVKVLRNFGNSEAITITSVCFIKAKETKLTFLSQPFSVHLKTRQSNEIFNAELICHAESWPKPNYQWYKDGEPMKGETEPKLKIKLQPKLLPQTKHFKCLKCKRVCMKVPSNLYKVFCSFCMQPFEYPQDCYVAKLKSYLLEKEKQTSNIAEELKLVIHKFRKTTEPMHKEILLEFVRRNKYDLFMLLKNIEQKLVEVERKRTNFLKLLLKLDQLKVNFVGEGEYACVVSHVRADWLKITKMTRIAVLYVSNSHHEKVKCSRRYLDKAQIERSNNKYKSIVTSFKDSRIIGNTIINFESGEEYQGPFLESSLAYDNRSHWGSWRCLDGSIIEGPSISNHFDIFNMNGKFLVHSNNGEKFTGTFVNGKRHGKGKCIYQDGSIYYGEWFQGEREGFGILIQSNGTIYDGEWELDQMHGKGVWYWKDGSIYVGDNELGKRSGKGIYCNSNLDMYEGEFQDNELHGQGKFAYADGSTYVGYFQKNRRQGAAAFIHSNGDCEIGTWRNDQRNGIFTVKRVQRDDNDNIAIFEDEVQLGSWDRGNFVEWISPSVNPRITRFFCQKFLSGEEKINGPYAIQIAKALPLVPHGIDECDQNVRKLLVDIAKQNQSSVGIQIYNDTLIQIKKLRINLNSTEKNKKRIEEELEKMRLARSSILTKNHELRIRSNEQKARMKMLEDEIEAFWINDKNSTRQKFKTKCENMKHLEKKEWFYIRRHRHPPEMLRTLMSGVCCIMMVEDSWKMARILLGSNTNNKDEDDEQSFWQQFDVKLLFMIQNFDVFRRADIGEELLSKISNRLADARMRGDQYSLQRFGIAAIHLVYFLQASILYIRKALEIKHKNDKKFKLGSSIIRNDALISKNNDKIQPSYDKESYLIEKSTLVEKKIVLLKERETYLEKLLKKCENHN